MVEEQLDEGTWCGEEEARVGGLSGGGTEGGKKKVGGDVVECEEDRRHCEGVQWSRREGV